MALAAERSERSASITLCDSGVRQSPCWPAYMTSDLQVGHCSLTFPSSLLRRTAGCGESCDPRHAAEYSALVNLLFCLFDVDGLLGILLFQCVVNRRRAFCHCHRSDGVLI